eukprot:COSAG06_NODE_20308_length_800_cov_1.594864_1_plen_190_part_01
MWQKAPHHAGSQRLAQQNQYLAVSALRCRSCVRARSTAQPALLRTRRRKRAGDGAPTGIRNRRADDRQMRANVERAKQEDRPRITDRMVADTESESEIEEGGEQSGEPASPATSQPSSPHDSPESEASDDSDSVGLAPPPLPERSGTTSRRSRTSPRTPPRREHRARSPSSCFKRSPTIALTKPERRIVD